MKNIVKRNESAFNGPFLDSTQPRREDRSIEMTPTKTMSENNKTEQNIQDLWDKIKGSNILVTGITEIRERMEQKYLVLAENIPKL